MENISPTPEVTKLLAIIDKYVVGPFASTVLRSMKYGVSRGQLRVSVVDAWDTVREGEYFSDTQYNLALKFGDFEWYRTISRSRLLKLHILLRKRMLSFSKSGHAVCRSQRGVYGDRSAQILSSLCLNIPSACMPVEETEIGTHTRSTSERGLFNRIFVMSFAAPLFSAPGNFPHFCVYQCTPLTWHMGNLYERKGSSSDRLTAGTRREMLPVASSAAVPASASCTSAPAVPMPQGGRF